MSRNYDDWERLVAAVLKRELYRQLCRQDSISTVCSDSDSSANVSRRYPDTNGGIVFIEGCNLAFEIEDLLRASAEFVGKGSFGSTYKAVLEDDTTIAVKRLRTENIVEREDFEPQMEFVGNIRHENVAPLRGYYYSKDEKLRLYDFYNQGSVSQLLHGKDGRLNWESRVKIAVGAAHGIAHIHTQSVFHGNIKSSNIFVKRQGYGCVCETGLAGMMMKKNSVGKKGDVYSFGMLLLELVTGKFPVEESLVNCLRCFEPWNLYRFHRKKDERKGFPFVDKYIDISVPKVHQELLNMLQVAKRCLALLPEERPSMSEVVSILNDRSQAQHQDGEGRLVFFEGCNLAFDLNGLLTGFGKVVGEGSFGTTYVAYLDDATTVAIKRISKKVIIGRNDFEQRMEVVGNIRHENVAPLRAYYYSNDVKLVIRDFYNRGSVAALLHGKRGEKNMVSLDWETRLKIGIGIARGIAHIHSQSGGNLVHGNIKSSNIFLNSQQYGCICYLGLATFMSPTSPPLVRSGYWAPEITDTRKMSQSSDVYSYGVFLLELLTGKSPVHTPEWWRGGDPPGPVGELRGP